MEASKLYLPDMADDCTMVLQLSKTDPLFCQKKDLLNRRGFDVKEEIKLQSSLHPGSIASTLETMLQIARINHLDEVELYFGDVNRCSSVEFFSPRNEVEALNSILAIVNNSLCSKTLRNNDTLLALQDSIFSSINKLTEKSRIMPHIDRSHTCEKEKGLVEWGVNNGVKSRLEIVYVEGAGRGAIAMNDLKVGDVALEIPVSIVISEELVHQSDMYHVLENINGISSETMLLLWSMKERHNCNSKFKIYFDNLPKGFNTGLSFGVDAIMALEGTLLLEEIMQAKEVFPKLFFGTILHNLEIMSAYYVVLNTDFKNQGKTSEFYQFKDSSENFYLRKVDRKLKKFSFLRIDQLKYYIKHLRTQYDKLVPSLCENYPNMFPPELYTWEQFLWACELWYSNSMKVMFPDGKLRTCLVPVAGFLNHSLDPHIVHYGKVDPLANTLKFPLSRPCLAGEQCCLSYGNLSSSHLITFYGFIPKGDNPYDVIPLDIDVGEAEPIEDCQVTTHMVRGTWFSKSHCLFHYGLPSPLLELFRRARNATERPETITLSNLVIEKEILEDLQSTFLNMMENLGDLDLFDRESISWDVKLALEYKDVQRRILSSILTSCDNGLKSVQTELAKLI